MKAANWNNTLFVIVQIQIICIISWILCYTSMLSLYSTATLVFYCRILLFSILSLHFAVTLAFHHFTVTLAIYPCIHAIMNAVVFKADA